MTQALIIIGSLLAIAAFVWWIKRRNRNPFWHKAPITRAIDLMEREGRVEPTRTASGAYVFTEPGAPGISHEAADQGIDAVFNRAACRYPVDRSQHVIKIVVLKGERAPESGTPCFRVPIGHGSPYFNSEWDMMRGSPEDVHYILAAGQMLWASADRGDVLIIPSDSDVNFIKTIVDYELEHCLLAWHDSDEHERTKIHGSGQGHPIIPECPGVMFTESVQIPLHGELHLVR